MICRQSNNARPDVDKRTYTALDGRNSFAANMSDKEKSKPVHTIRAVSLELAIWRNEGEKGLWFSVTAFRSYKSGARSGSSPTASVATTCTS
jgi:hypothetical protein